MHIIPVAINYDRLLEIRNLATEIVSGETGHLGTMNVIRMIREKNNQACGKVYMTFGQSVSLRDYIQRQINVPLQPKNLEAVALNLTTDLVLEHEYASPIVTNMIVAALLL